MLKQLCSISRCFRMLYFKSECRSDFALTKLNSKPDQIQLNRMISRWQYPDRGRADAVGGRVLEAAPAPRGFALTVLYVWPWLFYIWPWLSYVWPLTVLIWPWLSFIWPWLSYMFARQRSTHFAGGPKPFVAEYLRLPPPLTVLPPPSEEGTY